jgi:HD-GYP domain-containing protein (c-di-GMP phosphodiesterase class II)
MEKTIFFLKKHFDKVLALTLGLIIVLVNFVVVQKGTFLNLFYLPILMAGYLLGKKQAVLSAFAVVGLVVFANLQNPGVYFSHNDQWLYYSEIISWGGLLILAAYITGYLSEQREHKIRELTTAYIGIVEILTKYFLESSDRYTKGHSIRVADYATQVAMKSGLTDSQVENVRVAALLHDIGKVRIGSDLIQKATTVAIEEKEVAYSKTIEGSRFLNALGGVLNKAMPLVTKYHSIMLREGALKPEEVAGLPMEVRIIAVCDTFDALMMESEFRMGVEPEEAFKELTQRKEPWSDPVINQALKEVIGRKLRFGKKVGEELPSGARPALAQIADLSGEVD